MHLSTVTGEKTGRNNNTRGGETMKYITRADALTRILKRIQHQQNRIAETAGYTKKGHEVRLKNLNSTYVKVDDGLQCNRAIAQLFAAEYRIAKDQGGEGETI
jgi:hypothetical protein